MGVSLVKMFYTYVSSASTSDQLALSKQRTSKRRKEELLRDNTALAVSEKYIDALYYNEIFILWHIVTLMLQLTGS